MNLDQINVFGRSISSQLELNDATRFIDVVRFSGSDSQLTGLSLFDLRAGEVPDR
jgi:hypothetical protein